MAPTLIFAPILPPVPLYCLQVMTTRWGSDPFAYGSYSSMPVGTLGGPDYDILAESLGGRVGAARSCAGLRCDDCTLLCGAVRGCAGMCRAAALNYPSLSYNCRRPAGCQQSLRHGI